MPRVKFDYIVSFSSEDPEHPASNLLSWEVSKKKWLCAAGETSASVVLQLGKAVQIGTVAVGAHHAALVEVLVGRSETPAEPYQVLVASCVFLSPSESRKAEGAGVERVRSFTGTEGVWAQRWDRLRVLVSQPYNKHCKFGVSFVHVFSPDTVPARPFTAPNSLSQDTVPARSSLIPALDGLSSDEEEFKPGELFAQHKIQTDTNTTTDTGSQIRRASSQVLRTSADSTGAARLVKTPRNKHAHTDTLTEDDTRHDANISSRNDRTNDTGNPDDGIQRNVSSDRDQRDRKRKRDTSGERGADRRRRLDKTKEDLWNDRDGPREDGPGTSRGTRTTQTRQTRDKRRDTSRDKKENRERTKPDISKQKPRRRGGGLLAGVVCVLSGYEHPRRGAVRDAALALGARVERDWGPACTHLICAFPKTPKLRAVRGTAGGARVPAVLADWVEECARLRRRLPEEWFSTEPARRVPVPEGGLDARGGVESEDTDDEIERVLRRQRDDDTSPPTARDTDTSRSADSDVADNQIQTSDDEGAPTDVEADSDTDPGPGEREEAVDGARALPPLLRDMAFVSGGDRVDRYVRAYGGTVLPTPAPLEEVEGPVYALCEDGAGEGAGPGAGVRRLRLRWLWRAHREGRLPPLAAYILD